MAQGWRQSWADFRDSLRSGSPDAGREALEEVPGAPDDISRGPARDQAASPEREEVDASGTRPAESEATAQARPDDASADRESRVETLPRKRRRIGLVAGAAGALVAGLATVPWLLSPFHFGADWTAPTPPAPDVVATFDGGRITLDDVEAHLSLLVPARERELVRSPGTLLSVVEDLISDQLVLRWAAGRKPEAEESFRHAMKHINEELSLDEFAQQLHEETLPITESELRGYYEANQARFDGQAFAQARDEIRQILVAEREPEFIERYIDTLRTNASITRDFELLEVPPPSADDLERYYEANLDKFALPRRAVVDEIEIPISAVGDAAQQRASDLLLRIRGGSTFEDAAAQLSGARLSTGREVAEGTRSPEWDRAVFALVPGELGSIFRAGGSFYVVRLNELRPARTQNLAEVRPTVVEAVQAQREENWFRENGAKTLFVLKGQRYTLEEFFKEYRELPPSVQDHYAGAEGLKKLADSLIDRMLLVTDTYDKLLDVKTKPLADETRLRLLRQMMEQEEVDDKIEVTEAEMQAFYEENAERMTPPPRSRIRYIRIGLSASADEEGRARERAEEAYKKLVPGLLGDAADFAAVAQEYSEDPETAANGGEVPGWIGESSDPFLELTEHPFHEAVLNLEPGEISEPFELGDSLYIVKVTERTEPEPVSFEQARPAIEELLTEQKHHAQSADLQERLLKEANVVTYPTVLEGYLEQVTQPSADDGETG